MGYETHETFENGINGAIAVSALSLQILVAESR